MYYELKGLKAKGQDYVKIKIKMEIPMKVQIQTLNLDQFILNLTNDKE